MSSSSGASVGQQQPPPPLPAPPPEEGACWLGLFFLRFASLLAAAVHARCGWLAGFFLVFLFKFV